MTHDRSKLLGQLRELRKDPFLTAILDVSLTCRLRDEELCEVVQEVLQAAERAAAYTSRQELGQLEPYDPRD